MWPFKSKKKIELIEKSIVKDPTVMDLIKTQADVNQSNLEHVSNFLVKDFYREWVDSISKYTDLEMKNGEVVNPRYEFMYIVYLGEAREFMLNSWSRALDIITSEHPNIFIDAGVNGDHINAHIYYDKCLDDVIDTDDLDDNVLIKNWKKHRV